MRNLCACCCADTDFFILFFLFNQKALWKNKKKSSKRKKINKLIFESTMQVNEVVPAINAFVRAEADLLEWQNCKEAMQRGEHKEYGRRTYLIDGQFCVDQWAHHMNRCTMMALLCWEEVLGGENGHDGICVFLGQHVELLKGRVRAASVDAEKRYSYMAPNELHTMDWFAGLHGKWTEALGALGPEPPHYSYDLPRVATRYECYRRYLGHLVFELKQCAQHGWMHVKSQWSGSQAKCIHLIASVYQDNIRGAVDIDIRVTDVNDLARLVFPPLPERATVSCITFSPLYLGTTGTESDLWVCMNNPMNRHVFRDVPRLELLLYDHQGPLHEREMVGDGWMIQYMHQQLTHNHIIMRSHHSMQTHNVSIDVSGHDVRVDHMRHDRRSRLTRAAMRFAPWFFPQRMHDEAKRQEHLCISFGEHLLGRT